jgi:hypothetical protein
MTFPTPPPYVPPPPARFSRPFGIVLLGLLNALGAVLYLGCGVLLLIFGALAQPHEDGAVVVGILGGVIAVVGAFHAITATGLFLLKGFGRICQMVQSGIGLLAIPLGTIVSALILYYLTRPGIALLFSGRPPAAMTPGERDLVARDSKQGVVVVALVIVGLFGSVAVIGIVAAIAIPGLLRARMAGNEASALGAMRAMSSAQAVYSSTHAGRYGTLECLTVPSGCPNTDGRVSSTPFLSPSAAERTPRSGYRFTFHLSPDQSHFVYWAEPDQVGQSGERAFCVTEAAPAVDYRAREVLAPSDADGGCPTGGGTL